MKLLLIALLITPFFLHAQLKTLPIKDGRVIFEKVIVLDSSMTSKKIFDKAWLWFTRYYKNSKDVVQLTDPNEGRIEGKAVFEMRMPLYSKEPLGFTSYNISITTKDGRYRYQLSNLLWDDLQGDKVLAESLVGVEKKVYVRSSDMVFDNVQSIINDLETFMSSKEVNW